MNTSSLFPLQGIIGVVSESLDEIDAAIDSQLQCVEIRADLLLNKRLTMGDVLGAVEKSKSSGLACLVTLRHPEQGGHFTGSEQERVEINQRVLAAGADIIDLEWGTEAAAIMLAEQAPIILSHHNFSTIPNQADLSSLTRQMLAESPLAIKIVPTASTLADAVRMLTWVSEANASSASGLVCDVKRIGFAMGAVGACSRILTTAFGGPVTYTSFAQPVAPGQIALDELIGVYRVKNLDNQTRLTAVTGATNFTSRAVVELNVRYQQNDENQVAIAFPDCQPSDLNLFKDKLRITQFHAESSL